MTIKMPRASSVSRRNYYCRAEIHQGFSGWAVLIKCPALSFTMIVAVELHFLC